MNSDEDCIWTYGSLIQADLQYVLLGGIIVSRAQAPTGLL